MPQIKFKNISLFYQKHDNRITINYTKLFQHLTGTQNKFIEFIKHDFFANFVYNQMKVENKDYKYTMFDNMSEIINKTKKLFYEYYNENSYEGIYGPIEMLPLVLILYSPEILTNINSTIVNEIRQLI